MTRLLALLGPTASGKSEMALRLAKDLGAAILSVDSMQVYRGMDIGTAKPIPADRATVPHYMIDLAEPDRAFSVAQFQAEARRVIESGRHDTILIVGGSGLHFRAVVDPLSFPPHDPRIRTELEQMLDPASALCVVDADAGIWVDLANRRRVIRALEIFNLTGLTPSLRASTEEAQAIRNYQAHFSFTGILIDPADALHARIASRLDAMRELGLLDEVRELATRLGPTAREAVGYSQLIDVVAGNIDEQEGWRRTAAATVDLARKQRTFFRRDPRLEPMAWEPDSERRYRALRQAMEVACAS